MMPAGIYIHIPFCLRKCFYCDFYSEATNDEHVRKGYTRALLKEIGFYGAKYGKTFIADTVFFGGGTPSLMEPELIGKDPAHAEEELFHRPGQRNNHGM